MKLAPGSIETSFGTYVRSKPECITDPDVIKAVDEYKRWVAQKFLAMDPGMLDDIKKGKASNRLGENLFVSIKVDGEFSLFVYDSMVTDGFKSYFCNSSSHRVHAGMKVNAELEAILASKGITSTMICGELFCAPGEPADFSGRARLFDLLRYTRNPEKQDDIDRIGFRAFDVIRVGQEPWNRKPYYERFKWLKATIPEMQRVAIIPTQIMKDVQVRDYYEQVVERGGAEGIVIRNSETGKGYKVKPVNTLDAVIIGAVAGLEGSRIPQDALASALVALRYPDGNYQLLSQVGSGLDDATRKALFARLQPADQPGYIAATADGRAFRLVKPVLVAQVNYLDIISVNAYGNVVMQPCLKYDEQANKWDLIEYMPFVRLISPRFNEVPLRDDKTNNINDVRVAQVEGLVDINLPQAVVPTSVPKATLLARYVFEKGEMIRKFVGFKSNKSAIDRFYPEYVIYAMDFSTGRQEPLQRKARATNDEQQFWQMLESWIKEEVFDKTGKSLTRGWGVYSQFDTRPEPIELPELAVKMKKK
ncbi:MAG: hypothetical protein GYA24_00640 [Candidatus Lokiarchaeota archaeon]|nr:hypothetical protein [Candidatus Lokiarchaeota archaeon]